METFSVRSTTTKRLVDSCLPVSMQISVFPLILVSWILPWTCVLKCHLLSRVSWLQRAMCGLPPFVMTVTTYPNEHDSYWWYHCHGLVICCNMWGNLAPGLCTVQMAACMLVQCAPGLHAQHTVSMKTWFLFPASVFFTLIVFLFFTLTPPLFFSILAFSPLLPSLK